MSGWRKYRNKKAVVDGVVFDSQKEAKRYRELRLMERAGAISDLRLQPCFPITIGGIDVRYPNGRHMKYLADFEYMENGETVIEDCKGMRTPVYKLKRALMLAMGKTIREV